MKLSQQFNQASEHVAYASMVTGIYGTFIPYMMKMYQMGGRDLSQLWWTMAIVGALTTAFAVPTLRKYPSKLTHGILRLRTSFAKAPADIAADLEDIKARMDVNAPVKIHMMRRGVLGHNALTNGNDIYLGRALSARLSREERRFVIAHEMAHIKHKDVSKATAISYPLGASMIYAIPGVLAAPLFVGAAFYDYARGRSLELSSIMDERLAIIFAPVALAACYTVAAKAFSRKVEYRCDRRAVEITQNPQAGMSALQKLAEVSQMPMSRIARVRQWLLSTHQPIEKRIEAIGAMRPVMPAL